MSLDPSCHGVHRRSNLRGWALAVVAAALIPACGEAGPAEETRPPATTATAVASTTTQPQPQPEPAQVDEIARLPDEASLRDDTWAAIVFRQDLECVPLDADLAIAPPAVCETPVLFIGDEPAEMIGEKVPVWLVRWPVLAYALANGPGTLEALRQLPTLVATTSETYLERQDGSLEIEGRLPGGGRYRIEVSETTTFDLPAGMGGEPVALSDLTGSWVSENGALRIDDGGGYELTGIGPDGTLAEPGVFGFVAVQDGLLVFPSAADPGPCSGETGVFFGEMGEETLDLFAVDDPCTFRAETLEAAWSLSSDV
jgi:hypothetical protein